MTTQPDPTPAELEARVADLEAKLAARTEQLEMTLALAHDALDFARAHPSPPAPAKPTPEPKQQPEPPMSEDARIAHELFAPIKLETAADAAAIEARVVSGYRPAERNPNVNPESVEEWFEQQRNSPAQRAIEAQAAVYGVRVGQARKQVNWEEVGEQARARALAPFGIPLHDD